MRALRTRLSIATFVALSWLGADGRAVAATPFVPEFVDRTNLARYVSLALDSGGNPHVSYYAFVGEDLKYASRKGGSWTVETVESGFFERGSYSSLALDAQGRPHISYYDANAGSLRYATKSAGTWSFQIVDQTAVVGVGTSIQVDTQGNPRIAYYDATNGNLKYATRSLGVWTIEVVDGASGPDVGSSPSLALDALDRPHISYRDATDSNLKYAVQNAGAWQVEQVDGALSSVGLRTSLAVDALGTPHVAYYAEGPRDLKFAVKVAGIWNIETVDLGAGLGEAGDYPSIALDATGRPHVSYLDASLGLKYAVKTNTTWAMEVVDGVGSVGAHTSLALDALGNPLIAYEDLGNVALKLVDAALHLSSPAAGSNWPVGATREVAWRGAGAVSIHLSTDGGASYEVLQEGVSSSPIAILVPHAPTRFGKLKIVRSSPYSVAVSESLFTIQASIALLNFVTAPASGSGTELSWNTDPGIEDLAGYRLKRADAGGWRTLVELTRATAHTDPAGGAGARYRLSAVNGLGMETVLGEATALAQRSLAAWPLPYRGGTLNLSFAASGGLGGGHGEVEVGLYDIDGRRVRRIERGSYAAGYHAARWDGRDERGARVPSGLYFLRCSTEGRSSDLKVVVLP